MCQAEVRWRRCRHLSTLGAWDARAMPGVNCPKSPIEAAIARCHRSGRSLRAGSTWDRLSWSPLLVRGVLMHVDGRLSVSKTCDAGLAAAQGPPLRRTRRNDPPLL